MAANNNRPVALETLAGLGLAMLPYFAPASSAASVVPASASLSASLGASLVPARPPFAWSRELKSASAPSIAVTEECKLLAAANKQPHASVPEVDFEPLCADYLAWREKLSTGFGGLDASELRLLSVFVD